MMIFLQIIQILSDNLIAGLAGCMIITGIVLIGYLNGYKKRIHLNQMILCNVLVIYIIMVFHETIMSRDPIYGGIPVKVLISYKQALYSGESTNLILNICMFVPLGFILPLLSKKCEKWYITYSIGLCSTLFLEILQLITMRGIFEVDDIINNFLGCTIGYGAIMILISLFKKRYKILPIIIYQIPLLVTIAGFSLIFEFYSNRSLL